MPYYSGSPYDLYFPSEDLGLHILRDPKTGARAAQGGYGPASFTDEEGRMPARSREAYSRDYEPIWDNWVGGGGVSQADRERFPQSFASSRNCVSRYPDSLMPAGALTEVDVTAVAPGAVTSADEQDQDLYLVAGRYVLKITSGVLSAITVADHDLGAGITGQDIVAFDGALVLGTRGTGSTLWRKAAGGGSWTQADPATAVTTLVRRTHLARVFWAVEGGDGVFAAKMRLIGTVTNDSGFITSFRHISAGVSPLTPGQWSAAIPVANSSYPINSLAAANRHVWFCTSGGVADVDERGYSPILNPYFQYHRDDVQNGAHSVFLDGKLYVTHAQGLDQLDVSVGMPLVQIPGFCQFGYGLSNETEIFGPITALTVDDGWLVATHYNGTDSFLLYGKPGKLLGLDTDRMVWHPEVHLPGEQITCVKPASPQGNYTPRLWICSTDALGATHVRWESKPPAATPLQELLNHLDGSGVYTGLHRFASSWQMTFSAEDAGDQNARKIALRYDTRADRLNAETFLRLYARAETGPWVQQGSGGDPRMTGSPRSQVLPTDPLTKGHNITLRLDGAGTNIGPAVLREQRARFEVVEELRESRQYQVVLGYARTGGGNALDERDPMDVWNQLKRLQTREPIALTDEAEQYHARVRVNPGQQWREVAHQREGSETWDRLIVADIFVSILPDLPEDIALDASASPPLAGTARSTMRYGVGDRWGSGKVYGR